jgi:hypothetical protein
MTVEEQLKTIFNSGNGIRKDALLILEETQNLSVKLTNILNRDKLHELQNKSLTLYKDKFLPYDESVSNLAETLVTVKEIYNVKTQQTAPADLGQYTLFSIYSSQLSSQRETLRNLLTDIEARINSYRQELNNLTALVVAIGSILVSLILGFIEVLPIC